MTLESSTKAALDIQIDGVTDSVFRKEFQSKHIRMFNCHSLIDELVSGEEIPSHIDRWSNKIPLELRKSGKTGGEMKADRMFFAVRISDIATK